MSGCRCEQQHQGPATLSMLTWTHTGLGTAQQAPTHSTSSPSIWPAHLQGEHLHSVPPWRNVKSSSGSSWAAGGAGEEEGVVTEAVPFQVQVRSPYVRESYQAGLWAPQGRSAQLRDTALDFIKQTLSNQPDTIC